MDISNKFGKVDNISVVVNKTIIKPTAFIVFSEINDENK